MPAIQRPDDDALKFAVLDMQVRDLHNRILSLYLADPGKSGVIHDKILDLCEALQLEVQSLGHDFQCPPPSFKCPRGCCSPKRPGLDSLQAHG